MVDGYIKCKENVEIKFSVNVGKEREWVLVEVVEGYKYRKFLELRL